MRQNRLDATQGFAWILTVALLASVGLLLVPAIKPTPLAELESPQIAEQLPELTIVEASVRVFGEDGAASWSLESPRIVLSLDGSLDFALPRVLLQNSAGTSLRAEAGSGWLKPTSGGERMSLYSQVNALLENPEREVAFSTESLLIAEGGRYVWAPQSVQIQSVAASTRAANLEFDLDEQILLLGSSAEQVVHTRIQPAQAIQ